MSETNIEQKILNKVDEFKTAVESKVNEQIDLLKKENEEIKADLSVKEEALTKLNIAIVESNSKKKQLESKYSDEVIKTLQALTSSKDKSINDISKEFGLRTDSMPNSLIIPSEFVNELLKEIFNETAGETITSLVSTSRVNSKNVLFPVQQAIPVASRVKGECADSNCSFPQFHTQELRPNRMSACINTSWEFLNWQDVYTAEQIKMDIMQAFNQQRAFEIIQGSGNTGANTYGEYLGILSDERIVGANSASITNSAGDIVSYKDILAMLTNLKAIMGANQDATFVMNKEVWLQLATEEGTEGMPKHMIDFANNTLFGRRVIVTGDITVADYESIQAGTIQSKTVALVPEVSLGSFPVILGNFKRGYKEVIASDMIVIRDDITGASGNCTKWFFHTYNDGMPVLPDAFNVLKMSA